MARARGVKTSPQEQSLLISADPESFSVADYVGRFGWVSVNLATVDADTMRGIIVEAWRRTASRRLVKEYDAAR